MKITQINVRRTFTEGKLKALISITIDNCLAIHEIKIIQGEARLFVAMPNRMDSNGVFRDIVHPIGSDARNALEEPIISAYENHMRVKAECEMVSIS